MSSTPSIDSPFTEEPDATVLADLFDRALEDQFALNARAAARAETLAYTRAHPHVYAPTEHPDAGEIAERAVVRDAVKRFGVAENTVRTLAFVAETAASRLPELWRRAKDGYAAFGQVETAVTLLTIIGDDPDAAAVFDADLADAVVRVGAGRFRAVARTAARRLSSVPSEMRHRSAAARRRVIVDPGEDGMAWIAAYIPLTDALAAKRRLTATAKHLAKTHRDGRTRDQIRADLLTGWLCGAGTPTAVKTKVLITIPATFLTPHARTTVRDTTQGAPGVDLNHEPLLDARTPIDPHTAITALLGAGAFTRVITDPVTGVILDMDRTARTATPAQRDWLTLAYATCAVDGCEHPAAETDIDHWLAYHGPHHGPTNITNLHPLCGSDHTLKTRSKLRFHRDRDGTVHLHSPAVVTHEPHDDPPDDPTPGDDPPDDADEIRRITSAQARISPPTYGDDPPF